MSDDSIRFPENMLFKSNKTDSLQKIKLGDSIVKQFLKKSRLCGQYDENRVNVS